MSRNIAVITGTRAEYGLLYWTMRELQELGANLQLVVTGAHLSPDHGMTVKQIEADGFDIAARVDMELTGDTHIDITRSMGLGLSRIADALHKLKPDIVVILGDRYEMLAATAAASMLQFPIAHIHGGEVTEGAIDESIRHAMTKLSYWHFPTTKAYGERIVQLGEAPERVFPVGAPGIDNIARLPLLSKEELEKELGVSFNSPVVLFTYHPETLASVSVEEQIDTVITALEQFTDCTLIITGANADTGGRAINKKLQEFAANHEHASFHMSLGSLRYLSAMNLCDVVAGNSSSGMIETPSIGKATVNIGGRQAGRIRTPAVIDCECETSAIVASLKKAVSPEFQAGVKRSDVFGEPGQVGKLTAQKLMTLDIPKTPRKSFYDMDNVAGSFRLAI